MVVEEREVERVQSRVQPSIDPVSAVVRRDHARRLWIDVVARSVLVVHQNKNDGSWALTRAIEVVKIVLVEHSDLDAFHVWNRAFDDIDDLLLVEAVDE